MKFFNLLVLLMFLGFPIGLSADCILDNTDDLNGFTPDPVGTIFGQSFIACETGEINSILLNVQPGRNFDLFLVSGDGKSINVGTPFQKYNYTTPVEGMVMFTVSQAFPVVKGQLYSFGISGASVNYDKSPNRMIDLTMADGQSSFVISPAGAYNSRPNSDLYFKISNVTINNVLAKSVPALSQWAVLIFFLLLLNLSVVFIYRLQAINRTTLRH